MSNEVRVRFAPSPTGHLHIGNARTAILNWLYARHTGGTFILRIEDTDPERSKDAYIQQIIDDMTWLGLSWDEGPDAGGDYGPYRQSERFDIYSKYADALVGKGFAYPCYCTAEELEAARKDAIARGGSANYNGRCRDLSEDERKSMESQGRKPALRFRVPDGNVDFTDIVKGSISFPEENIGDFVIMRSEGIPTYNFAAVVDDHSMRITHIIRGDDHVSNTPRQIVLYRALGFELPQFAHIPMILGSDRQRLSKRHGATSIDEYQGNGYLPAALINYLSLLSWSSKSGDEVLSIDRLIEEFDFSRVSHAAAIFDVEKLNWLNGTYIRAMDVERLTQLAVPFFARAGYESTDMDLIRDITSVLQDKIDYLAQLEEHAAIFFQESVKIEDAAAREMIRKESTQKVLWSFLRELRSVEHVDMENFRSMMKIVQKETGVMGKDLWMPIRIALTGHVHGPELPSIVEIFGREKCVTLVEGILGRYS
ncbi:MAG: glutamate--tRNA ligase [candidate division KSB1 bacterium]|nr:glutamate--tRNA ligase [candidate division KSB1 bacterium]